MPDKFSLLAEGFQLDSKGRGLIIRVLWVVFVTVQLMWFHGLLAFIGLASPFATASDVKKVQEAVTQSTQPLAAGFKANIQAAIASLQEDIDVMEARQAADRSKWTELDQRILSRKRQQLVSQQEALAAIVSAEKAAQTPVK